MVPDTSMTVMSLPTRPKTVNYLSTGNQPRLYRHSSLRNIYGRNCPITLLGEESYLNFKTSRSYSSFNTLNSSSSSPSVPYSTNDILYNGETTRSSIGDDYTSNDLVYLERDKHGRLKESERRRPSSRNNPKRSISLEKVSINGEKDELQPIKTSATSSKQNHFRPTGIRQSYLRGEQFYSTNTPAVKGNSSNGATQGVQKDDLVAMGTIWNPNTPTKNPILSLNNKPYTAISLNNPGILPGRRGAQTSRFSNMGTGASRSPKIEVEPKYTDPAIGAPNSFQQRLIDLSALEAETVRWERSKKVKKKPKQDRDS